MADGVGVLFLVQEERDLLLVEVHVERRAELEVSVAPIQGPERGEGVREDGPPGHVEVASEFRGEGDASGLETALL